MSLSFSVISQRQCALGLGPRSLPRMYIFCLVCLHARTGTFLLCLSSIGLILRSSLECLALCYGMYPSTFTYNALQGQCSNVRQFVDTILAPHLHCRPDKQLVQLRGSPKAFTGSWIFHAIFQQVAFQKTMAVKLSQGRVAQVLNCTVPWRWFHLCFLAFAGHID